jgi:cysteine desulfurase
MAEQESTMEFLRTRLFEGLVARIEHVRLNGDQVRRLPNTLNLSFEFVEAESLLIGLDLAGIAVSSGSACSSGSTEPSHVLLAMGIEPMVCQGAIRISLGRENTEEDIEYALHVIPEVVGRLRAMSPFYER